MSEDATAEGTGGRTAGDTSGPTGREQLSYEDARDELLAVVRDLEQGGTTLEESIALWERGEVLARTCQDWLDGARRRLDEAMRERGDG